jgi:hypothetical protein
MSAESSWVLPFLNDDYDLRPGLGLTIDGIRQVDCRPVLNAPRLGENLGNECAEHLQDIYSSAGGGTNRSNYVNHVLDEPVGRLAVILRDKCASFPK